MICICVANYKWGNGVTEQMKYSGLGSPVGHNMFCFLCLFTLDPVTLSRFSVLPSGSLRITDVRLIDSKTYTCTAENPAGNVSLSYNLHIQGTRDFPGEKGPPQENFDKILPSQIGLKHGCLTFPTF